MLISSHIILFNSIKYFFTLNLIWEGLYRIWIYFPLKQETVHLIWKTAKNIMRTNFMLCTHALFLSNIIFKLLLIALKITSCLKSTGRTFPNSVIKNSQVCVYFMSVWRNSPQIQNLYINLEIKINMCINVCIYMFMYSTC